MFAMSVFQSVLARLQAEEEEEDIADKAPAPHERIRGLNAGFVADLAQTQPAGSAAVHRAYVDTASEEMLAPPRPDPPPVMPDHLHRLRPNEIAADLAMTGEETLESLAEKRRHFAANNHPDRHHPDFRANADLRMKIANMLIDEAMRRLRPARRR